MTERVLVVGCGNEQAGDDGAGAALIRRLMRRPPPACTLRVCARGPLDVLELLDAADSIVFVDAVVSGAAPGTIHLTTLPSPGVQGKLVGGISAHGWSVVEAIDLAGALHRRIPRVFLIGIEAGQMTAGAALSPAVERAVDYCEAHFDELRGYAERGETAMMSVATMAAQHRVLSPES